MKPIPAQYESRCEICEEAIYLDDPILPHPDTPGPDDVVWVHASCAEEEK